MPTPITPRESPSQLFTNQSIKHADISEEQTLRVRGREGAYEILPHTRFERHIKVYQWQRSDQNGPHFEDIFD